MPPPHDDFVRSLMAPIYRPQPLAMLVNQQTLEDLRRWAVNMPPDGLRTEPSPMHYMGSNWIVTVRQAGRPLEEVRMESINQAMFTLAAHERHRAILSDRLYGDSARIRGIRSNVQIWDETVDISPALLHEIMHGFGAPQT